MPAATPPPCLGRASISIYFQHKFIVRKKKPMIFQLQITRGITYVYTYIYTYMYIQIYKDRDRRASLAGIAVLAFCKGNLRASVWAVHIIFPKPDNTKHYIPLG